MEKTATKKCNRRGCGRDFTEAENGAHSCQFHPGQPIFHEGNKGWTCCSPRVLEFGEIFGIPGCASGPHSDVEEVVKPMETTVGRKQTATGTTSDGTEIYGSASSSASGGGQSGPKKAVVAVERAVPVQFEDPADAVIELGSKCQRNGCTATYQSPGSREESCWHHPGVVVFHDASKGWSCCKPRVADFSDLFQIEGCSQGRHNFVKIAKQESVACRFVPNKSKFCFLNLQSLLADSRQSILLDFWDWLTLGLASRFCPLCPSLLVLTDNSSLLFPCPFLSL